MVLLHVFNGKLYAGLGKGSGYGDILICDPTGGGDNSDCDHVDDWSTAYNGSQERVNSFITFNGTLYAGLGYSSGDVLICDPTGGGDTNDCDHADDWSTGYNGKLYAGEGHNSGDNDIFVCDPTAAGNTNDCDNASDWSLAYNGLNGGFYSLSVFNNKLYAGQGWDSGEGDVYMCDPSGGGASTDCDHDDDWSVVFNGSQNVIYSLIEYGGKLYAGQGYNSGDGDVYVCDPTTAGDTNDCDHASDWTLAYNGAEDEIWRSVVYKGYLYFGETGDSAGQGDVIYYGNQTELKSSKSSWDTGTHHIVATYDLSDLYLYVDGVQEATMSASFTPGTNSSALFLGRDHGRRKIGGITAPFDGKLGNFSIYDSALSQINIFLDYANLRDLF